MRRIYTTLFILFITFSLFAQDIVYDSLRGNKDNWRRIRWGSSEILNSTWFENQGIIVRSKVLLTARVWDGLVKDVDYTLNYFPFPTERIIHEYKTTGPTNLIIYKYYGHVDTIYYVGLRKAELGSDLFTGQYMIIDPVIPNINCVINIYNGIGSGRQLFLSIKKSTISDSDIGDYVMSNQVTFETISGTNVQIRAKILEFIHVDTVKYEIKLWPNPVTENSFNLEILKNDGLMMRIFDIRPSLLYQEFLSSEENVINVSFLKRGLYFVVISDEKLGNIYKTIKIIVM